KDRSPCCPWASPGGTPRPPPPRSLPVRGSIRAARSRPRESPAASWPHRRAPLGRLPLCSRPPGPPWGFCPSVPAPLPLPPHPRGHAKHRKVERAPTAQLVVHGVPGTRGRGGGEPHFDNHFVGLLREVVDAVVVVESRRGYDALARRAR